MPGSGFYFDPSAAGSAVFLGPTEARLMELAWTHRRLTVKNALVHLGPDSKLAYTTVSTILNRLTDKGLLSRKRSGRTYEYGPTVDRRGFLRERIGMIQACLDRSFGSSSGD